MIEKKSPENLKDTREELVQRTVEQLFSIVRQIHREVSPQESFLSPPQARLVFTIAKYKEEGISVKELAERADVTSGAITQFVDVLITKGLVRREEDPNDRRIVRLKLTSTAEKHLAQFRQEFLASAARVFNVLSTDELKQFIDLLTKVGSHEGNHGGCIPC